MRNDVAGLSDEGFRRTVLPPRVCKSRKGANAKRIAPDDNSARSFPDRDHDLARGAALLTVGVGGGEVFQGENTIDDGSKLPGLA